VVAHATLWDGDPAAFAYLDDYARQQAAPGEFEVCLAAAYITILTAHLTAHDRPDDATSQECSGDGSHIVVQRWRCEWPRRLTWPIGGRCRSDGAGAAVAIHDDTH
jgi:hypothetical protein